MTGPNKHCVSVVIPTTGSKTELDPIMVALQQQRRPADEIIIITDEQRRGAAWARNQGIARSKGDLIAFLDDDCLPPENWLETMVKAIDSYQADGAGGTYEETDSLLIDRRRRQHYPDTEQEDTRGLVGAGGNLMLTRRWLQRLIDEDGHAFNENFRISQDWELIFRSRQRGIKLVYIAERVKHLKQMSSLAYLRQQLGRGKGIAMLYQLQKSASNIITPHNSLVWGQGKNKRGANWLKAIWKKGFGPFDIGNFRYKKDFLIFWLGEKCQALGFFWYIINDRIAGNKH